MSSNGLEHGYGIDGTTTNAGSSTNPYAINDLADLQTISSDNWGAGVYYQQTADITLTTNVEIEGMLGNYDGDGYEINGQNTYKIYFKWGYNVYLQKTRFKDIYSTQWGIFNGCGSATNCEFINCAIGDNNCQGGVLSTSGETAGKNCIGINCIVRDCTIIGGKLVATRYTGVVLGTASDSTSSSYSVSNCVVIDSTASGSQYNYKIAYSGRATLTNNYATDGGDSTSGNNGLSITTTEYNSQTWWQNTALYDFSSTGAWEWDDDTSLPKLKHTSRAPTVTLDTITSPTAINTAISLTANGTPVTSGNTLTFQWAYSTDGTTFTNFGTATTQNPNTTTYTPTTSGTYYFRVTVTESGVSTTAQAVSSAVTVVPATVSISTQPSSPIAVGSTVTATATAHGTTLTYQWAVSIDGGSYANISGQTSATLNYITQTNGTYVFRVTVTEITSAYTVSATTNSVSVVTRVGDNDTYYLVGSDGTTIAFDDASYSVLRDSLEGLSGYPVDYEVSQTPGVLGTEVINTVINEREISLQVLIYGDGRAELEDRRRALIRALNPLVGPCKLYWHQENGNTYYITCRPDDGCPSFDEGTAHSARTWQCTLDLICHDPCWHSKEDKEYSLINDEVGFCLPFQIPFTLGNMSPDIYVENGTATSPIQVVLTGPMTAPIRIQNVTTDEEIYIRHDIDEDDTITINTDRSDIYVKYYDASEETTTSVLSYCSVGSKFWQLQPGMNHVHFEVYDIQEGANGVLKFSEKSVGI